MRDGLVNTKLEVIPGTQWAEFQKTAAPAVSAAAESRMQQLISIRSSERAAEIAAASTYSSLAAARSSSSQAAAAESSAAAEYSKEEERAYEHRWSTLPSCEIHNWHQWKDIHFHHIPALNASALAMHSNHFYQFKAGTPKKQWLAETGKLLKGHLLKCATATGGISRFIDLTYNDDGHQDATGTGHLSKYWYCSPRSMVVADWHASQVFTLICTQDNTAWRGHTKLLSAGISRVRSYIQHNRATVHPVVRCFRSRFALKYLFSGPDAGVWCCLVNATLPSPTIWVDSRVLDSTEIG